MEKYTKKPTEKCRTPEELSPQKLRQKIKVYLKELGTVANEQFDLRHPWNHDRFFSTVAHYLTSDRTAEKYTVGQFLRAYGKEWDDFKKSHFSPWI